MGRREWTVWRVAFVAATLLGLSSAAFVYFGMRASGKPLSLRTSILAGLPDWYFWACLTPLVFALSRRVRFGRDSWARPILAHLGTGALIVLVELAVFTAFNHWFYYNPWAPAPAEFGDAYRLNIFRSFHYGFLIYWVIVAGAHAVMYHDQLQSRALQAAHLRETNASLESMLAKARLDLLLAQLQPHFFFNTLNTISGLIRAGRSLEATDMVARLGQLFRLTLQALDRKEIPLREEVELVEAYVDIERIRFGEGLDVRFDVAASTLDSRVPPMLLQPLVENAIRHGLGDSPEGRVSVAARTDNGSVLLEVTDSGRARPSDASTRGDRLRIGLSNTRARLQHLYGDDCELLLRPNTPQGTVVTVRIPRGGSDDAKQVPA
jgi:sensor histidine kinase YesM